ncbi:Serine/threonine-protein kinase tel1 [Puccinia graminis f. sp. tritici]|uniref:Serine/threonine-protein kinase tel1 n=1 Tax=Puccinia graminis f. sp. tritici TaxID=56615 RepID=A0A5B0RGY0_PUCGR|nr:Serine/threonine-protein kinase tel1 [Puccinia graminis f. sp. tritici]
MTSLQLNSSLKSYILVYLKKLALLKANLRTKNGNSSKIPPKARPGSPRKNKWLDVPWLQLAKQATKWRMAASAFLFVEIAREEGLAIDVTKPLDGDLQSLLERLYSISPEPDAFYSLIPSNPTKFCSSATSMRISGNLLSGFHAALVEDLSINPEHFVKKYHHLPATFQEMA